MEDPSQVMNNLQFVLSMIFELFIPMTFASDLLHESEVLSEAVYSSNWLNLSMGSRKDFIMLQEGMKKPIKIQCFKWLQLNLSTFTTIIQTSYRWYTLMRDINK